MDTAGCSIGVIQVNSPGAQQRLWITFGRGDAVKYITHLDMMRAWERLVRRARLPVTYSSSHPPRPRLAIAAPLAVGVTSIGELLDIYLDARLPVAQVTRRLVAECPSGFSISEVQEVSMTLPSLQSLVRFSEYRVTLYGHLTMSELQEQVHTLLAATSLPRERRRDGEIRRYDLRPQVDSLWIAEWSAREAVLGMLLQTDEQATGRPDEVLAALGLAETMHSIQRVKLILARNCSRLG